MSSTFTITPFIASHANTSLTPFCTYIQDWDSRVPFFIPLQSIHDIAHTCLPAIHCIDSIYDPISCVPLSDKATNQIPHNFSSVILVLGATALRMGKSHAAFLPPIPCSCSCQRSWRLLGDCMRVASIIAQSPAPAAACCCCWGAPLPWFVTAAAAASTAKFVVGRIASCQTFPCTTIPKLQSMLILIHRMHSSTLCSPV